MILRAYLRYALKMTIAFVLAAIVVVLTATVIQVGGLTVRISELEGRQLPPQVETGRQGFEPR